QARREKGRLQEALGRFAFHNAPYLNCADSVDDAESERPKPRAGSARDRLLPWHAPGLVLCVIDADRRCIAILSALNRNRPQSTQDCHPCLVPVWRVGGQPS